MPKLVIKFLCLSSTNLEKKSSHIGTFKGSAKWKQEKQEPERKTMDKNGYKYVPEDLRNQRPNILKIFTGQ